MCTLLIVCHSKQTIMIGAEQTGRKLDSLKTLHNFKPQTTTITILAQYLKGTNKQISPA